MIIPPFVIQTKSLIVKRKNIEKKHKDHIKNSCLIIGYSYRYKIMKDKFNNFAVLINSEYAQFSKNFR